MNEAAKGPVKPGTFRKYKADTSLKSKALVPGNPQEALRQASKNADEAIEQLSVQFAAWMMEETARLQAARLDINKNGYSEKRMDRLYLAAHDIRGQAATYGYPVAGAIGNLLCNLLDHVPNHTQLPLPVLDQHVDAALAVVRQDIKGKGDKQTDNILRALQLLNSKTLQRLQPTEEEDKKSA